MKLKTRIIITVVFLIVFFSTVFIIRFYYDKKIDFEQSLMQTDIALTDDGTRVIIFEDEQGNEYIKFGDGPIERVME